ncbi:hypothetical protein [Sphingobacterium siyangense]|uniref:Uncharacterized protein n=1 Tax=Sphingobacterium siyangense TaxID=459529 RepID=A0A562M8M3_9SPHI|nr:hypothetical protein [Sphingobacterium siyangense]TWI16306.1 hypothetical protein IQ31_04461 [Sphingobacterium siyangense]
MKEIIQYNPNTNRLNQPDDLTHAIIVQVITAESSVKELRIKYCSTDKWAIGEHGIIENAKTILNYMIPIIRKDSNAVCINIKVMDIKKNTCVHTFGSYILKPEHTQCMAISINNSINLLN